MFHTYGLPLVLFVSGALSDCEVAVVDNLDCLALLGVDLGRGFMHSVLTSFLSQPTQDSVVPVVAESGAVLPCKGCVVPGRAADREVTQLKVVVGESESTVVRSSIHPKQVVGVCETVSTLASVTESVRGTRDQARQEQVESDNDDTLSSESACVPRDVDCILDFPESYFEEDPRITPVAELCMWPEVGEVDIPLPNTVGSRPDRDMLVAEQQSDSTLKHVLDLASKGEKEYELVDNILVQSTEDSLGDSKQRVVVPKGRRLQVLKLAHSSLQAGHFGVKKTLIYISCGLE